MNNQKPSSIKYKDIEDIIDNVLRHVDEHKDISLEPKTLRKIKRLIQSKNRTIHLLKDTLNSRYDRGFMLAFELVRNDLDSSSTATEFYNRIKRRLNYEDTKEDTNS